MAKIKRTINKAVVETEQPEQLKTSSQKFVEKLTDDMIKKIEHRLTLPGGTTMPELGMAILVIDEGLTGNNKERRLKVGRYHKLAMSYIEKTYGKPILNPYGKIVNYGEQIELKQNGHLRRLY